MSRPRIWGRTLWAGAGRERAQRPQEGLWWVVGVFEEQRRGWSREEVGLKVRSGGLGLTLQPRGDVSTTRMGWRAGARNPAPNLIPHLVPLPPHCPSPHS